VDAGLFDGGDDAGSRMTRRGAEEEGDAKTPQSSVDARTCFPAELAWNIGMHPCSESHHDDSRGASHLLVW
jgi:hypothetical protein